VLDLYNKGLKLFSMREWETARQYFAQGLEQSEKTGGADFLCGLYLKRAEAFAENPPPEDWDGTTTLTEK
jgi:adenylate cyclase